MNNVVCFFVDSVAWDCIGKNRASVSPTPFLDSLKFESITASKLYSHGPYTDAATRSLFTGRNCLDDFGYYFKLNTSPVNHYKVFHDAGYETYDFNYPYYILGNRIRESIDHVIHSSGFIYGSEWGGIYSHYHDVIQSRPLSDDELLLLKHRIQLMFDSWGRYLEECISSPDTMSIHKEILAEYDARAALVILREEEKKFRGAHNEYINDFIRKGLNHKLAHLDNSGIETYIDGTFFDEYIEGKYKKLLNRIAINNFKANFIKNCPSFKRLLFSFRRFIKTKDASNLLFIQNYIGSLFPMKLMRKRWKEKGWQNQHTAYTMYKEGLRILKQRNSDKPFYFFFDVEEPHNNIAFFSYDIKDKDVIDQEMDMLGDYVKQLGTNFKGSLPYLLSLRYSDYQIEKFCDSLKEMGLWDKTTILFISDHGSSYTFYPLHNRRVNCFDDECYHIPMILRHPGIIGKEISTYQYSKDVLPTLCDILNMPLSQFFKGRSMLSNQRDDRKFVVHEYMGPGCPDMLTKPIWFSARDEEYLIAYKVRVFDDFENGELVEVYEISTDSEAYYNVIDSIDRTKINYLLKAIKDRHKEIQIDTEGFMTNLRANNTL